MPPFAKALTDAERRVAECLLAGANSAEAAAMLGISVRTVDIHRMKIMNKSGALSSVQLGYILAREGYEPAEGGPVAGATDAEAGSKERRRR